MRVPLNVLLPYAAVVAPMLAVLIRERAPVAKFLLALWYALPATLLGIILALVIEWFVHWLGVPDGRVIDVVMEVTFMIYVGYRAGLMLAYDRPLSWHRRGAVVADGHARSRRAPRSAKRANASDPDTPIHLAGHALTAEDETKHFKFIGTTGTGKSTAIHEILSAALARGDRAVIADPDGGYLNHFYDPKRDVILNPFDPDSLKWSLFSEITNAHDVDQLARSLIPEGDGSEKVWPDYARTFFTAVVQQCIKARITDDAEIHRLVKEAPLAELRMLLTGTVAGPFLEEGNERMFGSIRSVTSSAVRALEYIAQQRAAPFSVRRWVREGAARRHGGQGGVLFLPYKAGEIASLRSTISAWMRIAIFQAMDRGEGDQRLWFVIDELDALGDIDGLKDALARLRKFGGRCVLGFQSISQMSATYGRNVAATIVENCGNTLILRCSASEQGGTSQFASRLIGQREVVRSTRSSTQQSNSWFGSVTTSEQQSIEPAVMASEVERLADLHGFLKIAAGPNWMRVHLDYVHYPSVVRPTAPVATPVNPGPASNAQVNGGDTTVAPVGATRLRSTARKKAQPTRVQRARKIAPNDPGGFATGPADARNAPTPLSVPGAAQNAGPESEMRE